MKMNSAERDKLNCYLEEHLEERVAATNDERYYGLWKVTVDDDLSYEDAIKVIEQFPIFLKRWDFFIRQLPLGLTAALLVVYGILKLTS